MAYSKEDQFTDKEQDLSEIAKAISHPARIAILKALAGRATCICGELVSLLPLAQSTVSQHLKALKEAGLIKGELEGPKTCYCLDPKGIKKLSRLMSELSKLLEDSITQGNCC